MIVCFVILAMTGISFPCSVFCEGTKNSGTNKKSSEFSIFSNVQDVASEHLESPLVKVNLQRDDTDVPLASDDIGEEKRIKTIHEAFSKILLRLADRKDDLYSESRFRRIIDALKTAFISSTGAINQEYLENVIRMFVQWDAEKRNQFNAHAQNAIDIETSSIDDFVERFLKKVESSKAPAPLQTDETD